MSVLIKGMEMPTSCDNCWALDDYGDYPRCRITEEQRGYNFPIREKRMDNCPLAPVPPHGRLIDADALYEDCALDHDYEVAATTTRINEYMQLKIDAALTVIEAEGEKK